MIECVGKIVWHKTHESKPAPGVAVLLKTHSGIIMSSMWHVKGSKGYWRGAGSALSIEDRAVAFWAYSQDLPQPGLDKVVENN
jgi:hypothetical protein